MHILTDGRDVPDGSSLKFIEELEGVLKELQARPTAVGRLCGFLLVLLPAGCRLLPAVL